MGARPRPHGCSALPKASLHHVSPEAREALEGRRIPQSPGLRLGESQTGTQGCPGLLHPPGGGAPSESLANLCQALVGGGQAGDRQGTRCGVRPRGASGPVGEGSRSTSPMAGVGGR